MRLLIAAAVVLVVILAMVIIGLFTQKNSSPDVVGTGGSGQPEQGTVILQNMDVSTTDNLPFNRFVSISDNQNIRDTLRTILMKESRIYTYYNASVVNGSVVVNYDTNDITFVVKVSENGKSYKGALNTETSALHFYSEDGSLLQ